MRLVGRGRDELRARLAPDAGCGLHDANATGERKSFTLTTSAFTSHPVMVLALSVGALCARPTRQEVRAPVRSYRHSCALLWCGICWTGGHTGASGRQAQCRLAPTAAFAPSSNTRWALSSKAASALSWLLLRPLAPPAASLTLSCTLLCFCRAHQVAGLQAGRQRLFLAQALGAAGRVAGALRQPVRGAEHAGRGRGRARHAAVAARRKRGHRAREPAPRAARALETR